MRPQLSIIIPAYNVEQSLDRCVQSVLDDDFQQWEIILVDDGSTDGTPQRCDEWVARDERIGVLHQRNGGLSAARNAGLRQAAAEYVTFVDSDDYLRPGTYHELFTLLTQHPEYDLLEFPVFEFYGSSRQRLLQLENRTFTDMRAYWTEGKAYAHSYAWNKIYRRRLFSDVAFPVGKVFEDIHTLPLLLKKTKVVATTTSGLYYYCDNSNGITATAGAREWQQLLDAHLRVLSQLPADETTQEYYLQVLNIQLRMYELSGEAPLLPSRRIRRLCGVRPFILQLKALALNLLGMHNLCRLNRTLKNLFRVHAS